MTNISELLDIRCVEINLRAKRKKEIIEELVDLLHQAGKIKDPRIFVDELLAREQLASTGIGKGVAIPHRLLKQVPATMMAFGRKPGGVNFDAIDGKPVTLFFLILGPEGQSSEHLKLLSRLSRFLHDDRFLNDLTEADSAGEVIAILRKQEMV